LEGCVLITHLKIVSWWVVFYAFHFAIFSRSPAMSCAYQAYDLM